MKQLKVALIGFGTVGQGLAEIIREKADMIGESENLELSVIAISDLQKGTVIDKTGIDLGRALSVVAETGSLDDYAGGEHGGDAMHAIRESGADAICEATWTDLETGEPGITHCREAIGRGMHVATTNKGPVVLAAHELMELAASNGVRFLFEGVVMSGTPTLSFAMKNLAGCRIDSVQGILNGTTNYILSEMEAGKSYEDALDQAQKLGYAEAVPDADVEGHDAAGKVAILSNLLLGGKLGAGDVETTGITGLSADQVCGAPGDGFRFKLIGKAVRNDDGSVDASVQPVALPLTDPLAGVGGATNAITFQTDLLGPVTVVGAGAGKIETGFSLFADLLEIGRSL